MCEDTICIFAGSKPKEDILNSFDLQEIEGYFPSRIQM
jgi:hypothetical protein